MPGRYYFLAHMRIVFIFVALMSQPACIHKGVAVVQSPGTAQDGEAVTDLMARLAGVVVLLCVVP
jgi:hypothetical protein